MFCPVCGSKEVVDVFCLEHLKEQKPLVEHFKPLHVDVCVITGGVRIKGRWRDTDDTEASLRELVPEHIVPANYAEIKHVRVGEMKPAMKEGLKQEGEVVVSIIGRASPKADAYEEEYVFPYTLMHTRSPRGKRAGSQYFEGTLQVRNEDEESRKALLDLLHDYKATVAKRVRVKSGSDYYLSSKGAVRKAAKALQHRFGGIIKESRELFSRNKQTSKDIYRVTSLIELPDFKEGDVVKGETPLLVEERGKRIRFRNLRTGKTEYHEYAHQPKLIVVETSVAEAHPRLTVIHPETFQPVRVENQRAAPHEPGEHVDVALDEGRVYLMERSP